MIPTSFHIRLLKRIGFYIFSFFCILVVSLMIYVTRYFDGNAVFPVECAVVFGAAVHRGGEEGSIAGPGIMRRVGEAAQLYRDEKVSRLILTGGKGNERQDSEAVVMRKTALLEGVDPAHIVLEAEARSTWQNLEFVKPIVEDCSSIVGISDRYHLSRILLLARQQGWNNLQVHPASQTPSFHFELKSTAREAVGLMYYFVRHQFR